MNKQMSTKAPSLLKVAATLLAFSLTACANLEEGLLKSLQSVEDSLRGYRIQYHSIPAGASIVCDGVQLGAAPFNKHYDLSAAQRKASALDIANCNAIWPSGANARITIEIPLDRFPTHALVVIERPADVPDYQTDEDFGSTMLAARQKIRDDLERLGGGIAAGIHQASSASKTPDVGASMPGLKTPFRSVADRGGVKWNWVMPTAPQLSGNQVKLSSQTTTSGRSLTPLVPASSCLGSIVMGRCEGRTAHAGVTPLCVGSFTAGRCIGTVIMGD